MLELHPVPAGMIGCFARPAALDKIAESTVGAIAGRAKRGDPLGFMRPMVRVAPDELLLLPESREISELEAELTALDEHALVVDLSSGYATWALSGDDRFEAFSRLSALRLPNPPVAIQGLVAHVPAKVIVLSDVLLLIVSSVLSHHIRERVLTACADLSPSEGSALRPGGVLMKEGEAV